MKQSTIAPSMLNEHNLINIEDWNIEVRQSFSIAYKETNEHYYYDKSYIRFAMSFHYILIEPSSLEGIEILVQTYDEIENIIFYKKWFLQMKKIIKEWIIS